MRTALVAAILTFSVVVLPAFQASVATSSQPRFEVASIHENVSGSDLGAFTAPGETLRITNQTPFEIIRYAYDVLPTQVLDAPEWTRTTRFDILAKFNDAPRNQVLPMLRELLRERFRLVIREESRELPVYVLGLARDDGRLGPKLTRSTVDCSVPMKCATGQSSATKITGISAPMSSLVRVLSFKVGETVVDRTGLTGVWDFELISAPGTLTADQTQSDAPSIFTAVQEQLGLKLERRKEPAPALIVERVERPTPD